MKRIDNAGIFVFMFIIMAGPALAQCYVNDQKVPCDSFWIRYVWILIICLLPSGLIFLIKPDWHIKFLIWSQKVFMGAKFIPSKKTEIVVRLWGVAFIILALVFLYFTIVR